MLFGNVSHIVMFVLFSRTCLFDNNIIYLLSKSLLNQGSSLSFDHYMHYVVSGTDSPLMVFLLVCI